jgi:hypothetical protein
MHTRSSSITLVVRTNITVIGASSTRRIETGVSSFPTCIVTFCTPCTRITAAHTLITYFVTAFRTIAEHSVIGTRITCTNTGTASVTGISQGTEEIVVTGGTTRIKAVVNRFVTGTITGITANTGISAAHTLVTCFIAALSPVTELAIITTGVSAAHTLIPSFITAFRPIAVQPIITTGITAAHTLVTYFVTALSPITELTIISTGITTAHTLVTYFVAALGTVTEQAIITTGITIMN